MKRIMAFIAFFIFTTSSYAGEISEAQVRTFLYDWLEAQNTGSYSNYANMYSGNFTGIKRSGSSTVNLNHDTWLKDRKKMFKKKMVVEANNPIMMLAESSATVKFEQIWKSGTYKDKGDKLLNVALEKGKLKIKREEMLFSKSISNKNEENDTSGSNIIASEREAADSFTFRNQHTSIDIDRNDCFTPPKHIVEYYDPQRVYECPAPKGWHLYKIYTNEREWLDIAHGRTVWSTHDTILNEPQNRFGNFPSLGDRVEWRTTSFGEPNALIFRIIAQDPEIDGPNLTRLFVIGLTNIGARFCGMTKSNQKAKEIADKAKNCSAVLPIETLPN